MTKLEEISPIGIPAVETHYRETLCHILPTDDDEYRLLNYKDDPTLWEAHFPGNRLSLMLHMISPLGHIAHWPHYGRADSARKESSKMIRFMLENTRMPDPSLLPLYAKDVVTAVLDYFSTRPCAMNDLTYKNTEGDLGSPTGDGSNLVFKLRRHYIPPLRSRSRNGCPALTESSIQLAVFDVADSYRYIRDVELCFGVLVDEDGIVHPSSARSTRCIVTSSRRRLPGFKRHNSHTGVVAGVTEEVFPNVVSVTIPTGPFMSDIPSMKAYPF